MDSRSLQHRGVVVANNGMVAASQPLAVSAAMNMLQNGGSFADAAIAASAVLCVVEPYASHLGGDAFMIDGKRVPFTSTALCLVDPSLIPQLAIDHIDVLADGASATYGSDAIAALRREGAAA